MFPVIFSLGPFTLYTFSIFLFLAFFFGLFVIWKRGRELHFDETELFDGVFAVLLWMVVGARIGYVMAEVHDFGFNVLQWVNVIGRPGFLYVGGLVGAGFGMVRQAKKKKWDFFKLGDVLVSGLVLSQAIVALGAFFNGSGYGIPTESFLGVNFPGLFDRRHPVQLYETVLYAGLFAFLWWVEGEYRRFAWYKRGRSAAEPGFLLASFLMAHGVFSFGLHLLRPVQFMVGGIRLELIFSVLWLLIGIGIMAWRSGWKWPQSEADKLISAFSKKGGKARGVKRARSGADFR